MCSLLTLITRYGFDGVAQVAQGLWIRTYRSILSQIVDLGFNSVRITFSNQMLRNGSQTAGIDYFLNPDLEGLTPLECLDAIIGYAEVLGLRIILSRFSAKSNNFANEYLWYIPDDPVYTEELFVSDWVLLAQRYAHSAVVAADLWDEPSTRVTWGDGSNMDWKAAAEAAGNAIQAVNPDWLIMVAGTTYNSWGGSHLIGVQDDPIILSVPNKLVYTIHEYTTDTLLQPWLEYPGFPNSLRPLWTSNFGFLLRNNIAPVIVTGFGASFQDSRDYVWFPLWMNFTNGEYFEAGVNSLSPGEYGMSWMYWALNPGGSIGGILNDDWRTVDAMKMAYLSASLAPKFSEFDAETFAPTALPTLFAPTLSPTKPIFPYFHTNGSQIVDSHGNAIRFSGVNW